MKTLVSFSWLHLLKCWSLLKTRGGSVRAWGKPCAETVARVGCRAGARRSCTPRISRCHAWSNSVPSSLAQGWMSAVTCRTPAARKTYARICFRQAGSRLEHSLHQRLDGAAVQTMQGPSRLKVHMVAEGRLNDLTDRFRRVTVGNMGRSALLGARLNNAGRPRCASGLYANSAEKSRSSR